MAARAICQRDPDTAGAIRRADLGWQHVAVCRRDPQAVLAPDIDSSVLAGYPFAENYLGFDGHPTTVDIKATSS